MTVTQSKYDIIKNELYQTESWATEALLRILPLKNRTIWEPAAGNHMIADVLRRNGNDVVTSDIETYDREHNFIMDFFNDDFVAEHDDIITNPPYGFQNKLARKFTERSLEICSGYVAMFLQAKFDFGKTRTHLFADNPRFMGKIALLDRVQLIPGTTVSGTEDHAWFIWGPKGEMFTPGMWWEGKAPRLPE